MSLRQKLKKLQGINNLSNKDYEIWRQEQIKQGKINTRTSLEDQDRLYKNQQFVKKYGMEAFKSLNYQQRDAHEKKILDLENETIVEFHKKEKYSPYRLDGTVDPNQGTGDVETFNKIMSLDMQSSLELEESGWLPKPELEKAKEKHKKDSFERASQQAILQSYGNAEAGFGLLGQMLIGDPVDSKLIEGRNKNKFDKILAKDIERKKKQTAPKVEEVYNSLHNLSDEEVDKKYQEVITGSEFVPGIPQLKAFYDKDGKARQEVSEIGNDEKKRIIAQHTVYNTEFDPGTAFDIMDKNAKDYIADRQSSVGTFLDEGSPMLFSTLAGGINGIRNFWYRNWEKAGFYQNIETYRDKDGNFIGREDVDPIMDQGTPKFLYTDPITGESKEVLKATASASVLDDQGIGIDGYTIDDVYNNKYWSNVEATGSYDKEEQQYLLSLNGYTPYKKVYKYGEDTSYIREAAKMGFYATADLLTYMPIGGVGLLGKGAKLWGAITKVNALKKGLDVTGKFLGKTSKYANYARPFYSAIGMGNSMGRSAYNESLQGNIQLAQESLYKEGEELYRNVMNNPQSDFDLSTKAQIEQSIETKVQEQYNNWIKKSIETNGVSPEATADPKELQTLKDQLREQITQQVSQQFIEDYVNGQKQTARYDKMVDEAVEAASDAAYTLHVTSTLKGSLVNAFGFRRYLFKDPLKRTESFAGKVIKEAKQMKDGKLHIKDVYHNVTKADKVKNFSKTAIAQSGKEFTDEFADGLLTSGSVGVSNDRMTAYLNGEYGEYAENKTYDWLQRTGSFFHHAAKGVENTQTWEEALVGAISPFTTFMPNVQSMLSPEFRQQWKQAKSEGKSVLEMANMLVTNGVINTYYDKVNGEREAKNIVNMVNQMIDDNDSYQALSRGLALDKAKLESTTPDEAEALDFMRAAQIINQLNDLSNSENSNLLLAAAKKSDVFSDALNKVDKILNDDFTENEAREILAEYYTKNPSVPQSEENSKKALEIIKSNATKLKKGAEVFNEVNNRILEYEESTGKKVNPVVKSQLVERLALDQFLEQRVAENEERISGNKNINAQHNALSYGTKQGVANRISDLDHTIGDYNKQLSDQKQKEQQAKKELEDYLQSINQESELTSEEFNKIEELQRKANVESMKSRVLSLDRSKLVSERNSLKQQEDSWDDSKILNKDEILNLSPEDRARILSSENVDNYSPEQVVEINKARQELVSKGNDLLKIVQEQAKSSKTHENNKQAYANILADPESAAAETLSDVSRAGLVQSFNRRTAQLVDNYINKLERNPDVDQTIIEDTLYKQLISLGIQGHSLKGIKDYGRGITNQKYSTTIDKAIGAVNVLRDVNNYAKQKQLEEAERVALLNTSYNILAKNGSDKQQFLNNLGQIVNSDQVPDVTRASLGNLLNKLEEVWGQQSKAKRATKEQRQKAQKQQEEKKKAEQEKKTIEEDLLRQKKEQERLEAEKKKVEEEVAGITEKDKQVDNESTVTEEQKQEIIEDEEVIELESPSIEEQLQEDTSNTVHEVDTPTVDISVLDETIDENSSDSYLGNMLYRYDADSNFEGIQIERKGSKPDDVMNQMFTWFKNEGIKLQEIIDSELYRITQLGVKIHPLTLNPQKNATNDQVFTNHILWAVEYTNQVKRIHNEDLGGVVQANGKQYLIVGQAGFAAGNNPQRGYFNALLNSQKGKRNAYFNLNKSERFFVDESIYTEVKEISSGSLIRQQSTDTEVKPRPVTELLEGNRNPRGKKIGLGDLKWGIAYGNKMATVNVAENKKNALRPIRNNKPGSVYLYVEAADGKLTPAFIQPLFASEMRDGSLKDEIITLFNDLSSLDHAVRLQAQNKLRYYIYLDKNKDWILLGTPDKPTVSLQREGSIIKTFDLTEPDVRTKLVEFLINDFNPRINITTSVLKDITQIRKYAEAGALDTDIAQLGTSNASYSVYTIREDGKPKKTVAVDNNSNTGSDLFNSSATTVYSAAYQGKTATKDSNGIWKLDGQKVTDAATLSQLEHKQKLDSRNLSPVKTTKDGDIYILSQDSNYPIVYIKKGDYIRSTSLDEAKIIIKEINAEQEEKTRQERIKTEQQKETKIEEVLNNATQSNTEVISEDEILQQQLGDFTDKQVTTQEQEVKPEPIEVEPQIDNSVENANKSLADLQSDKEVNDLGSIINSEKYMDRFFDILEKKEDWNISDNPQELAALLEAKGITTSNITNVEAWLDMIEKCK